MKAEELDEIFDRGDDITPYLDLSTVRRLNLEQRRVNVDLPAWMIQTLDDEADRIGVTRQSIIKVWIAERIKEEIQIPSKSLHPNAHSAGV
jgi:CopG antitoxin of type II toxin-antitoxin system